MSVAPFTLPPSFLSLDQNATYRETPANSLFPQYDEFAGEGADVEGAGCMNAVANVSYMNVSCTSDLDISVTLFGYCSPFLVLTTVISNTLIVMVLSRRNMQTPTNALLMGKYNVRIPFPWLCPPDVSRLSFLFSAQLSWHIFAHT